MNRVRQVAVAMAVATVVGVSTGTTQSARFGLGGGLTLPLREYHTTDKAGWHVLGKVEIDIPESPIDARVDGMYSRPNQRAPSTGNTTLAGRTADPVWHIPTSVLGLRRHVLAVAGACT